MVKLTADLIQSSFQHINPVRDRELDLRGYKIPMIENLGATLNQFDTIDFSDNDIRKLDNFPLLPRLKTVLINNNRIVRLGSHLEEAIPNLETLILTNNIIGELSEIDHLTKLPNLRHLSLLFNPVSTKEHYKLYIIYKLPQLKTLDFRKIKLKERETAKELFRSALGKQLRRDIASKKAQDDVKDQQQNQGFRVQNEAEAESIRAAIRNASSLEEIERLNQMLKSGQMPQTYSHKRPDQNNGTNEN